MSIEVRGLSKRFGGFVAVQQLDIDIADGEFFVLLGPSGCGKSTTLRMIDAARTYDIVHLLTRGGPDFATDVASIYLQRVNFQFFNLGYGSALSWLLLVAILVVVLIYVRLTGFLRLISEKEPS